MSETIAINRARERGPATVDSLAADLASLGVEAGQTLIVHASLSKLGWVAGGPLAVIDALRNAIGDAGTLVMPTHTVTLSDPRDWSNPPVPEAWWPAIREQTPAFDPRRTPSTFMGVVAETFRSLPGVVRSNHPIGSFAAQGPQAETITADHPIEDVFGDGSPLGRLYDLDASVLLLGVGHQNNTSLHLAEARVRDEWREQGSPILKEGVRAWVTYQERLHDSDNFFEVGAAYADAGGVESRGRVGAGEGLLAPVRGLVDFAAEWMQRRATAERP